MPSTPASLVSTPGGDPAGGVQRLVLEQAGADRRAPGLEEGVGHGADHGQGVDARQQVLEHARLGRDLRSTDNRQQRLPGRVQGAVQSLQLGQHQQARVGRQVVRDADHRRVGAVRGREGIVDVNLPLGRKLACEGGVVLLVARIEADVLEQDGLALGHLTGRLQAVGDQPHPHRLGHGPQREPGIGLSLGPAEM
jgi:hypothetical protein